MIPENKEQTEKAGDVLERMDRLIEEAIRSTPETKTSLEERATASPTEYKPKRIRFCYRCGREAAVGSRFCDRCGRRIQ